MCLAAEGAYSWLQSLSLSPPHSLYPRAGFNSPPVELHAELAKLNGLYLSSSKASAPLQKGPKPPRKSAAMLGIDIDAIQKEVRPPFLAFAVLPRGHSSLALVPQ
jgi:hypothetical protein